MDLYVVLSIIAGLQEICGASMVLVTPKDTLEESTDNPDALCCSLACSICSGLDAGNFDPLQISLDNPICKCDPLCIEYEDCCPGNSDRCPLSYSDRSSHHNEHGVKFECVRTSNRARKLHQDKYGFFMVSSCPGPADWGGIGELCRTSQPNFGNISTRELNKTIRMLPVASNLTGLHYRNIYCALCNGAPADSLVPWVAWSEITSSTRAEVYTRYWFEPPSAPSPVNVTRPRGCITGVVFSDPTSQNSSIANKCSSISHDLETELKHSEQPCLSCEESLSTGRAMCIFRQGLWHWPVAEDLIFKIPFNFPSFLEQTEHADNRPNSCPDQLFFDLKQRRCVRVLDQSDLVPPTEAAFCEPWQREHDVIWMCVHISILFKTFSQEALRKDIRSALRKVSGTTAPHVEIVPKQHNWNPLNYQAGYKSPEIVNGKSENIVVALTIYFSSPAHVSFNLSSEQSLSTVAEDLLGSQTNRSYRVFAVEYMLPCANYSIDQCVADFTDTVQVDTDEITVVNGTVNYNTNDTVYRSHRLLVRRIGYVFKNQTDGDAISKRSQLLLCNGTDQEHLNLDNAQHLIYVIGTVVSLIGLLLTFITYSILPGLRTVPGVGTMNLVVATFSAQLGLLLAGRAASTAHPGLCTAVAVLLHFVWLASFSWTSCLALGLSRTLGNPTGMQQRPNSRVHAQAIKLNALYGWGAPLLVVAVCVVIHFAGEQSRVLLVYGTEAACWIQPNEANLVAFGVPVLISLLANVGMFTKAVRGVRASKRATRCLKAHSSFAQRARAEMTIYVKVSMLMGFSWFWGFLGAFTNIHAFWFIFIILNSFQGAYIFVAFVCSPRVLRMLIVRLRGRDDQSQATCTQTARLKSYRVTRTASTRVP